MGLGFSPDRPADGVRRLQYLAPEVVMQGSGRGGYENVVDSWAVGVIVYSMMTNVSVQNAMSGWNTSADRNLLAGITL